MINLFTTYYEDKNELRNSELLSCLKKNIDNQLIDKLYVIIEYPIENIIFYHNKVKTFIVHNRPTYGMFFEIINKTSGEHDINILANSDIYFDESISLLEKKLNQNDCYALCRWEDTITQTTFLNRPDAQDSWIFKGKVKPNVDSDFCMGICGCDNAIADRLAKVGYNVTNPSRTIRSYHLHNSGIRNYNINNKVPQPYKVIHPTE